MTPFPQATPRTAEWRSDRKPNALTVALVTAALLAGVVAALMGVAVATSRWLGRHRPCVIDQSQKVLGVQGLAFHYQDGERRRNGWAPLWDVSTLKQRDDPGWTVRMTPVSALLPATAVLIAPDGLPAAPIFLAQVGGLFVVAALLVWPAGSVWSRYRMQWLLVRQGTSCNGRIIRHHPFDPILRTLASVELWFEYPATPGTSVMVTQRVPARVYRALRSGQAVTVLRGKNPRAAVVYEACDVRVTGLEDAAPMYGEPLPQELELKYGSGTWLWQGWGLLRALMLIGIVSAPLWGRSAWSQHAHAGWVSMPGTYFAAPWLVVIVVSLVVLYLLSSFWVFLYRVETRKPEVDHAARLRSYAEVPIQKPKR